MSDLLKMVDAYLDFLRNGFELALRGEHKVLVTPFTDPSGDCIEIRTLTDKQGNLLFGDCGAAYDYLFMHGINPLGPRTTRLDMVTELLENSGATLENGEVQVAIKANENPGQAIHRLLQTVLSLQDLVYTARTNKPRVFKDEVEDYLRAHDICFQKDESLQGYSKTNRFDFVFHKTEQVFAVRTLSTTTPGYAKHLAVDACFAFIDVKRINDRFLGLSILDDEQGLSIWEGEPISILTKYSDRVFAWSKRDDFLQLIA